MRMSNHASPLAPIAPPASEIPVLFDRAEAASRLSVSLRTVDELISKRAIEIVKIGRSVRIKARSLTAFIEANTVR